MKRTLLSASVLLATMCLAIVPRRAEMQDLPLAGVGNVPFADADGDGIPDSLEATGFEIEYPDGSKESIKSTPKHKDIFVFVAWMADATHSHKPDVAAMNTVIRSFEDAPIQNLDHNSGIVLHIIYAHEPVPEEPMLGSWISSDQYDWTEFNKIKAKVFPRLVNGNGIQLDQFVHFCLFAHDYSSDQSSGLTNTVPGEPGADFMVTLGGFSSDPEKKLPIGTPAEQAGTFMHELGHALGLRHGGGDDINFKPNYISIMNYLFQMNGIQVDSDAAYTYSSFELAANESHLSGSKGLTYGSQLPTKLLARFGTQYYCPGDSQGQPNTHPILSLVDKVDWLCNGQYSQDVAADINQDGALTNLLGRDDWRSIDLVFAKHSPVAGIAPPHVSMRELTPEVADGISMFPIEGVLAKRRSDGIEIRWRARPLGQMLSYVVYRETVGQNAPVAVGTTASSRFLDYEPVEGGTKYYVAGLYAPLSRKGQSELSFDNVDTHALVIRLQHEGIHVITRSELERIEVDESPRMKSQAPSGPSPLPLLIRTALSKAATLQ